MDEMFCTDHMLQWKTLDTTNTPSVLHGKVEMSLRCSGRTDQEGESLPALKWKRGGWEKPRGATKAHCAADCWRPGEKEWTHLKSPRKRVIIQQREREQADIRTGKRRDRTEQYWCRLFKHKAGHSLESLTKPSTKTGYNNAMKTEVYGATAEMNLQTHTAVSL